MNLVYKKHSKQTTQKHKAINSHTSISSPLLSAITTTSPSPQYHHKLHIHTTYWWESRDFLFDYQKEKTNGHNSKVTGLHCFAGNCSVFLLNPIRLPWKFGKSLSLSLFEFGPLFQFRCGLSEERERKREVWFQHSDNSHAITDKEEERAAQWPPCECEFTILPFARSRTVQKLN